MGPITRTLLFSDIEGSTALLERAGDRYWGLLSRHREIIRAAIAQHDGREHGTEGDSFFVSFDTVPAGLSAAIEAQRILQHEPWPEGLAVRVRIGLHVGDVVDHGIGLVGVAVHHAARVASTANGGQIVVSDEVSRLMHGRDTDDGLSIVSRGHFRLRDMGVVELHQVVGAGLEAPMTNLRANPAARTNLPRRAGALVGREREQQTVADDIRAAPVVTLVGPGGVGKTSLAIEVAGNAVGNFDGGAWLVELGGVNVGDAVLAAVADAMSVTAQPGVDLLSSVVDHVGSRETLLVVDNCEHLLAACRHVVERLVGAIRTLSVLTTSREPLGLRGERVVRLEPLVAEDEVVELFTNRALQVDHTFAPDTDDRRTILDICQRLDGVPLAIELAAARVRSMSLADISARLSDRFRLLRSGDDGHDHRHRTLRAAVDWSYRLLDPHERRVFERLSIFNGAIDLAAVEAVCDDHDLRDDVVDVMQSLVDRSMAVSDRRRASTRYRLLETMREYAGERLAEHDDTRRWRDRHLEHFARSAQEHDIGLISASPEPAHEWFSDHWDEIRGAMRWALESGRFDDADRLVVATAWFAVPNGRSEHLEWAERLWALDGSAGRLSTAGCGVLAWWRGAMVGDEQGSWLLAREGLARATDPTHRDTIWCWTCLPVTDVSTGPASPDLRFAGLSAVLSAMRDPADDWRVLIELHDAAWGSGDMAAVTATIATMREVLQRVPAPDLRCHADMSEGHLAMRREPADSLAAARSYRSALEVARSTGNVILVGMALRALAFAAVHADAPGALPTCAEAVETLHEARCGRKLFQALESAALALARLGRLDEATIVSTFLERESPDNYGIETDLGFRAEAQRLIEAGPATAEDVPALDQAQVVALVLAAADVRSMGR